MGYRQGYFIGRLWEYIFILCIEDPSLQPRRRPLFLKNHDRFVDDMSSQCSAPREVIETWVKGFREKMMARFGLDITYEIKDITEYTQFLDIVYKVEGGSLTTDLYRKKTDANRYLEFSSYHPQHTFRSI